MQPFPENRGIEFDRTGLRDLLGSFLKDPFVMSESLKELSIEEVGSFFETQPDEPHSDVGGFDRSKSLYCLILLELELLGYTTPPDIPLNDFYHSLGGDNSQPFTIPQELPDIPFPSEKLALDDLVLPGGNKLESSNSKDPLWTTLVSSLQSHVAQNLYELSLGLKPSGNFSSAVRSEDLERLKAQCQIWSIECELKQRLQSSLARFWPQRDSYISRVIYQNGHAYDFHPSLKTGLERLAKDHPEWLYENKFPIAGIMSSLRYLLSVPDFDRFVPAAIDFATLLLLFGRNAEYGAQLLYNILGIQGLKDEEILELSARLSRLQRFKAKILNPHQQLSSEIVGIVKKDTATVFPLVLQIELRPKAPSIKEVA